MKISLRTAQSSAPPQQFHPPNNAVFTHIGPIMLEVQPDGAIHAIAQDFGETRTYVVEPADAIAFAQEILRAAMKAAGDSARCALCNCDAYELCTGCRRWICNECMGCHTCEPETP